MKCGVPAVRMDVTPDSSIPCAAFAAYCTASSAIVADGSRGHSRCTCTSHNPGSRYAPARSITCAPAEPVRARVATSTMRPASIATSRPALTPGRTQSITFAFARTSVIDEPRRPRSAVVERAPAIAQPEPHEVPLALGLRPVAEAGPLVGDPPVVQKLHLARLEVEVHRHVLAAHDRIERLERRLARVVERHPGQRLSVPHLKAREAAGEPTLVQLEDGMVDHHHIARGMLALPVEAERPIE